MMDEYVSAGMVGSIVDANGLLLARRPLLDGDDLVGQPTIPAVRAHLGQSSAWWIEAVSRTGVPTYTSLLRSNQSNWSINLALPRDVIDGPLHRTVEWIVALTAFTLVLGLALARLISRRFLAEFSDLERYVAGLRSGAIEPKLGAISEVNRMKKVLYQVGSEPRGRAEATEGAAGRDQSPGQEHARHRAVDRAPVARQFERPKPVRIRLRGSAAGAFAGLQSSHRKQLGRGQPGIHRQADAGALCRSRTFRHRGPRPAAAAQAHAGDLRRAAGASAPTPPNTVRFRSRRANCRFPGRWTRLVSFACPGQNATVRWSTSRRAAASGPR